MKEKANSKCAICGKDYYVCVSCKDFINLHPWKYHTDTAEHYKIFQILLGETNGIYTTAEAKKKLQNVDLSDKDSLRDSVRKNIDRIMSYKEDEVKTEKSVETKNVKDTKVSDKKNVFKISK